MSQANIPNITPLISISTRQSANLLLSSIALEEIALAHIMNAEAEKIQFVLGTLNSPVPALTNLTLSNVIQINDSVRKTLNEVVLKEVLLQMKFKNVLELFEILTDNETI